MEYVDVPDSIVANLPMGQISPPECKMLYWLASKIWTGQGEIVEIGSLYGKSTVCIARGMKANPCTKTGQFHAYDRWIVDDENTYMMGQLKEGYRGSFRNLFDENIEPLKEFIVPHEGDVFDAEWCGKPIEILFIDCSVSVEFHEMIFKKFYPFLQRGSILIHQDYFLYRSYYLPLMMAKLYEHLQEWGNADTSMIFQMLHKIPPEMFDQSLASSDEEIITALKMLISVYGVKTTHGGVIASMLVYFYKKIGENAKSEAWAEKIIKDNGITETSKSSSIIRNLKNALAGI